MAIKNPKYHFVPDNDPTYCIRTNPPATRLMVQAVNGNLMHATLIEAEQKVFYMGRQGVSYIVRDIGREHLDKLHIIPQNFSSPHFEHGKDHGPRVDLFDHDFGYATDRLTTLYSWFFGLGKAVARQHYLETDRYFTEPRLKQLEISDFGLERKINDLKARMEELGKSDDPSWLSRDLIEIKAGMDTLFTYADVKKDSPKARIVPSKQAKTSISEFLVDPFIFTLADTVRSRTVATMDQLCAALGEDGIRAAYSYWQDVAAWGDQ